MLIGSRLRLFVVFFTLAIAFITSNASANVLEGVRVWPSPDETRVVIDVQSEVSFTYFTLTSPERLVIDLKNTSSKSKLPMKVTDRYGHRLVVDLPHDDASSQGGSSSGSPTQVSRDASQFYGNANIVVAIDAGHGGEDPGSIGPTRKYEKNATLSISKKLVDQLDAVPGIKGVLTRRGDYFVNLNKRSEIARKNKAHLLVSIHADAFSSPKPRGASVFVLNTRRANTEIARWVENHEQQSELLGGAGQVLAKNNSDRNVSQTLLDLQFSHSQKEGYKVATNILSEMGKVAHLHKADPVNASLAVLKSPDIPSVLVETGFISNPTEEQLLFQRSHQDKLAVIRLRNTKCSEAIHSLLLPTNTARALKRLNEPIN